MDLVEHKDIVLPDIDLSHDDGDESWHAAGGEDTTPIVNADGDIKLYSWNGLGPGHYESYWQLCVVEEWDRLVENYEANPDDVHSAWWYVDHHPVFWNLKDRLHEDYPENHVSNLTHEGAWQRGWPEITPHKINPDTNRVEDDDDLNTEIQWWYELGPSDLTGFPTSHDYELDGGGATYEECVIAIARKIHDNYGNDRRLIDQGDVYWQTRTVIK